ncbi:MAG TPA: hypothetical protein VJ549_04490 [Geothrix sp.]|nr:hypothetical protein [Geothrix sp.]
MPLPAMQAPPALVVPAPTDQEAENALLEAFDWERPLPPAPKLKGAAGLRHAWLRAAATFDPVRDLPANPFATGRERQEAEALRQLLRVPQDRIGPALKTLPMRTSGTALALWRWGQIQVRNGTFDPALRQTWEDRLVASGPLLTRAYGLRHALCWALAQGDEARFSHLRSVAGPNSESMVQDFQRLFGWLGNSSPTLRLWSLPGLDYQDLRLDQLGAPRVWIHPAEEGTLPTLPAGTAWIIPSATGGLDDRAASLSEALMLEGQALADRLRAAGARAYFAPSQAAFEPLGLLWFPILIELDAQGNIRSIRMGDAAPRQP